MTKEERQLLIKDLCARFPYGVMCRLSAKDSEAYIDRELKFGGLEHFINGSLDVKPYLRPMSSMTEKEEKEYNRALKPLSDFIFEQDELFRPIQLYKNIPFELYEFFNSHYLDFRGFIPMGLALEATEDMYKID